MVLRSVELNNFMSYQKAKFEFETGLALVAGPNGNGKSSLWDAPSWCIFNKTVRESSGDEVVNRKAGKDCQVQTHIEANGKTYVVVRNRKHKEFLNRFWVEVDGKKIEKGTVDQTQDWLIEELGIDFDLFQCTILFGQDSEFNFINETNAKQKAILSKIMRVDFSKYQGNAKSELKAIVERSQKIQRDLAVLESHKGKPEDKYATDLHEWEADHAATEIDLVKDIAEMKKTITSHEARVEGRSIEELKKKLESFSTRLADVDERLKKRSGLLSTAKSRIAVAQSNIDRLTELSGEGKCPTCETEVDVASTSAQIRELERERETLQGKKTLLETNLEELDSLRSQITDRREHTRDVLQEVNDAKKDLEISQRDLRRRNQELKDHRDQENPWLEKIELEKKRQGEIETKAKELEKESTGIRDREPYLDFWVRAFGDDGIKSFIFDVICGTLTTKANSFLNILTGGEISVLFDTQKTTKGGAVREKFDCQVITNGASVPYHTYSGGEKRRVSLAVDMALSEIMADQYGSAFNLVVFDEQTNYMDKEGRTGFMNLLKDIAKKKAVYVVDHDAEFKSQFDKVLTIEKKEGVSRIC